jgi:hypothetical protein
LSGWKMRSRANFKALAATLLAKELAESKSDAHGTRQDPHTDRLHSRTGEEPIRRLTPTRGAGPPPSVGCRASAGATSWLLVANPSKWVQARKSGCTPVTRQLTRVGCR